MWTTAGNLVASATLPAGSSLPLEGAYRYLEIPTIEVAAGETLVFVRLVTGGAWQPPFSTDFESLPSFVPSQPGFELSGGLTYKGWRFGGDGLEFPDALIEDNGPAGAGAVNFRYEIVPAPMTGAVASITGVYFLARRRRTR